MHQKCSNSTLTNLLFGLCRFVLVIDLLVNLISPYLKALAHPFTPEVLRATERAPIPSFTIFIFGLVVSPSRSLGVHRKWLKFWIGTNYFEYRS
jgi:hypothetical protein